MSDGRGTMKADERSIADSGRIARRDNNRRHPPSPVTTGAPFTHRT